MNKELSEKAFYRDSIAAFSVFGSAIKLISGGKQEQHNISFPMAVAMSIQLHAQDQLASRLNFVGEKEDMETLASNLDNLRKGERVADFLQMAGGAALKSVLEVLQTSSVEGYWSDDMFVERINSNLENTPILNIKWETKDDPEERSVRLSKEVESIRQTLREDTTFLTFLKQDESGEYANLPKSIREFLKEHALWKIAFDQAVHVFQETCRLKKLSGDK